MASYVTSILLEWSADPLSDSTPTYTAVANGEIRDLEWWAGIDREGNDPEPGGMVVTLKNKLRKWEPLFGSNTIDTQQRFRLTLDGVQEGVWYTESFSIDYPSGQDFSWVTIACGDGTTVLAQDDLPSLDPPDADTYADVVAHDQPLAHYPLDDARGTQAVANLRTIKRKGKKRRKVKRGQRALPTEAQATSGNEGLFVSASDAVFQTAPVILGDTGFSFRPGSATYVKASVDRAAFYDRNGFTIEIWNRSISGVGILCAGPHNAANTRNIFSLTSIRLELDLSGGLVQVDRVSAAPSVGDIEHRVGTWDGHTACLYINGVLEASSSPGGQLDQGDANEFVYVVGGGASESVDSDEADEVAFYEHALTADRVLAHFEAGAERGYPQQTAGERIAAIATSDLWAETEIQTSGRDILPIMQHGQPKLEEIAEAAHAEGPRTLFFFNGDGNPVYLGHEWQATDTNYNTVQYTFADDGTGLTYNHVQLDYDFDTFNEVLASHESGESVIVTNDTEQAKRGRRVRTEETDLLLMEHIEVESLATHVLRMYEEPAKRPVTVTIDSVHCLAQILDLDIGHMIRVKKAGETGAASDRICNIIAKRKSLEQAAGGGLMRCTYTLSRGFDPSEGYWRAGVHGFSEATSTTKAA